MIEEWRPIPSFPVYEASSLGRIRSTSRVLKQQIDDDGYYTVTVYREGRWTKRAHWLVCEAFHGLKPAWAAHAAHNNGIKAVNRPGNVRWSTILANAADTAKHGTRYQGERHHAALFTEGQVRQIRAQYAAVPKGSTVNRLANAFDVSVQTIRDIAKGRSWKHIKQPRRRA